MKKTMWLGIIIEIITLILILVLINFQLSIPRHLMNLFFGSMTISLISSFLARIEYSMKKNPRISEYHKKRIYHIFLFMIAFTVMFTLLVLI